MSARAQELSHELREHMPVSRELAYFDHAAVAPLPDVSAKAIATYAQQISCRGDLPWLGWSNQVSELRTTAAAVVNAEVDEIALVASTTHGISLVAEGFPWKPGDNVVVPENEFPSNLLPWQNLQRLGVELRRMPVDPTGEIDVGRLSKLIDQQTRIVSLSWVGFVSGYRVDLKEIAELVHSRGALFFVDAIQGLGAFAVDVRRTEIDFLCADGHKWMLGPEGAGVLFVRRPHLELLQPLGVGWNSLRSGSFDPSSTELKPTAARYEGGSTNMPGMIGFGSSLGLLWELQQGHTHADDRLAGESALSEAVLNNVASIEDAMLRNNFMVFLPREQQHRSGIVGIGWAEAESGGESLYLDARKHCISRGVVLSVRGGRLRVSTHAYNNSEDIQRLTDALIEFRHQSTN